ncbi:MAG: DUF58 domain-containing protein, partial [Candidatus Heimdallarchaeota archaeon]|nr:DUF58 domain-containing protein [Candidatus Heimdallarchaeota archaeon]
MSEIKLDTGISVKDDKPIFFVITSNGALILILSIVGAVFGFFSNNILLIFPSLIYPIIFMYYMYQQEINKEEELSVLVEIPSRQVKAKSFVSVLVKIHSNHDLTAIVELETTEGLFPVEVTNKSIIHVSKNELTTVTFLQLAPRRGKELIKRVIIKYDGIFGLFYKLKRQAINIEIFVLPEPQRVEIPWKLKQRIMDRFISEISIPAKGRGSDFLALRDFIYGDDIRHISWKASAKYGKIIVKEYEEPHQLRFLIVVDASLFMAGPKLEFALSSVIELCTAIYRSEHSVYIMVHGQETLRKVNLNSFPTAIKTMSMNLYDVKPQGTDFNVSTLHDSILHNKLTNTVVILISSLEQDPKLMKYGLTKLMPNIQRLFFIACNTPGFGVMATAAVRDEEIFDVNQMNYRKYIIEPKVQ